ncbi:MAG: hypothetical protein Q9M48_04415 [Rhodobacterales bacterium]|nr:hypothetical protein [Rhodobacterales bacterium]
MHTDGEIYHLARLAKRLETDEVIEAFYLLISELYRQHGEILRPASQGDFSVLQIRPDGKNCFAFKGAKERIRFYFRKPAFGNELSNYREVLETFPWADEVQNGEIAVNIRNLTDAKLLLVYLARIIHEAA